MSGADLADFYVHTASVRPYLGMNATGRTFGPSVTVPCFLEDIRRQVTKAGGDVVTSTTTLYCDPSFVASFTVDSEVTANSLISLVIRVARHDSAALDLPDHLEIYLS